MQKKIQLFMEQHHMIERGDRVVAGVSGGADSVCLLLLLHEMSCRMGFFLAAVHVEHGIRGEESRRDADFTEKLCANLGVPFLLYTVNAPEWARTTGKGLEEAARELRYDCFFKACRRFRADRIALAHHANDNAETMLFHLARGTGIRGLCGIRPVTEMDMRPDEKRADGDEEGFTDSENTVHEQKENERNRETVSVIRPLLSVTREEIEQFLDARGQDYCIDSTNGDMSYTRNRMRGLVLPEMEAVNPRAAAHMQAAAVQLQEICDYLDEAARQAGDGAWEAVPLNDGRHFVRIFEDRFSGIPFFLQKHLLHLLLGLVTGSRKNVTSFHVESVLNLMRGEVGKKVSLPFRVTAERTYEGMMIYHESVICGQHSSGTGRTDRSTRLQPWSCEETDETVRTDEAPVLRIPGETPGVNGWRIRAEILDFAENSKKIPKNRYTKWFDYDKIKFVVQLRGRRPGDYMQVNAAGGHKKLNRYLIDEKIPQRERDSLSLLADGDHIMWVIGYRISEAYKVTEETKRVLCVQIVGDRREQTDE